MDLTGLALSGGGIRSATFCLGFLQGLHAFGLLSMFDYLSTVSGGGFVGGFWSAWLARTQYSLDVADISWPEGWDTAQFKCLHLDKVNKLLWCYGRLYSPEDRDGVLRAFKQAVETAKSESVQVDAAQSAYDKMNAFFERVWAEHLRGAPGVFPPSERIEVEPDRVKRYTGKNSTGMDAPCVGESGVSAGDDPIHHIRLFSNYLTPRKGLLSTDTWRAATVVMRNLVMNWLVIMNVQ